MYSVSGTVFATCDILSAICSCWFLIRLCSNVRRVSASFLKSVSFFRGFGGEVVSALAFYLYGRKFKARTFPMRLERSPHVKRVKSQRSAESRGFSPGTPVSSHSES